MKYVITLRITVDGFLRNKDIRDWLKGNLEYARIAGVAVDKVTVPYIEKEE